MPKTPEEIAADEAAASREQREQLAREANKKRNDAMLEARNAIADRADEGKVEEDELEPLTDEVWDQADRPDQARKKTRAELIAEQEAAEDDEDLDKVRAEAEAQEDELDEAREAGADDSRRNANGETEYRVEVGGQVKWLTLQALREQAGHISDESDTGRRTGEGVKTPPTRTPSPEAERARAQAEERRKTERAELRARLKDLNLRASMGDEQAIDELTDLQLEAIQGDSDRLLRKVDERVDARIVGRTDFQKAVDWFEDEYSDVLTTPRLKAEAGRLDKELADANPDMPAKQRLDMVGKQMRQLREDLGGTPPRRENPRPKSKLERKREAPQVPQAAGRTRPDVEPDETETTAQAIQRMAQSRGQGRAISHKH